MRLHQCRPAGPCRSRSAATLKPLISFTGVVQGWQGERPLSQAQIAFIRMSAMALSYLLADAYGLVRCEAAS